MLWRTIHRESRCGCRGNIAVEVALVAPLMTLLFAGIFQYSSGVVQTMSLSKAARAAAQYAIGNTSDTTGIRNAAVNAGNLVAANVTVTSNLYCLCSNGAAISCSGMCTDDTNPEQYISVTVTQPYVAPIHIDDLSLPTTLNGSATMRVR